MIDRSVRPRINVVDGTSMSKTCCRLMPAPAGRPPGQQGAIDIPEQRILTMKRAGLGASEDCEKNEKPPEAGAFAEAGVSGQLDRYLVSCPE